jgi:hypothetical protein
MRIFESYAPPVVWGPWQVVASHAGSVNYEISVEPIGDTVIYGQVQYWKGNGGGNQVVEDFRESTNVSTSNSYANVEVRFKGIPTGTAVRGTIAP